MRQRKAKDMEERLARRAEYMVQDPSPQTWAHCFGGEEHTRDRGDFTCEHGDDTRERGDYTRERDGGARDLFLEIGCGKGQFIIQKAMAEPEHDFIAIEGQETVILRALEKTAAACGKQVINDKIDVAAEARELPNLKFACTFVNDMSDFFAEGQLAGIYLNFSDPWPKARHAKRRLTYRSRLLDYGWALRDGGFIEIKTDNDGLFEFTLEEIEAASDVKHAGCRLEIVEQTRDLHGSSYASKNFMTEYEEKFSSTGKNINYVKVIIKKNSFK